MGTLQESTIKETENTNIKNNLRTNENNWKINNKQVFGL